MAGRNCRAYRLDLWPLPAMPATGAASGDGDSGKLPGRLATLAAGLVGMGIAVLVLVLALVVLFVVN